MNIAVIITHWPRHAARFEYFIRTVQSLYEYLPQSTTAHEFQFYVGMDQEGAPSLLCQAAQSYCRHRHINVSCGGPVANLGSNLNRLLARVSAPYVLYFQDDFLLTRPLPLDYDVSVLQGDNHYSVIRYAAHARTLESTKDIQLAPIAALPLRHIQPDAFYYWSFNPFLAETEALRTFFGPFPETRDVENCVNRRLRQRPPWRGILVRGNNDLVQHIGDRTSMIEKFSDAQLHPAFGADIPPRLGDRK